MWYRVTVKFSRLNVKGTLEDNEREGIFEAQSKAEARNLYLKMFKANEPNRRKIKSVKVVKIDA